jgi:hypothetical protein
VPPPADADPAPADIAKILFVAVDTTFCFACFFDVSASN